MYIYFKCNKFLIFCSNSVFGLNYNKIHRVEIARSHYLKLESIAKYGPLVRVESWLLEYIFLKKLAVGLGIQGIDMLFSSFLEDKIYQRELIGDILLLVTEASLLSRSSYGVQVINSLACIRWHATMRNKHSEVRQVLKSAVHRRYCYG